MGELGVYPAFVVAKGGITSSDVGVKALKTCKAKLLGKIRPGIPVWQTDQDSKFPEIPCIIFPGNVGEEESLREAVEVLTGREKKAGSARPLAAWQGVQIFFAKWPFAWIRFQGNGHCFMEGENTRFSFLGLGNMGKPLAMNLVKAGEEVLVFTRRPECAAEFQRAGARTTANIGDLAD